MIDHQPLLGMQKLKHRERKNKRQRVNDESSFPWGYMYQDTKKERHKSGTNLDFYSSNFSLLRIIASPNR
jgi:hypothetical protein